MRFASSCSLAFLFLVVTQVAAFATPPLLVPWPCGVTYQITQDHNGGSHTGLGAWAWDFGIGVGSEVVAPAAGVVRRMRMDSATGGCDSAYANDANYVVLDFGDGSEALFLHMQQWSSTLQVGQTVEAGDVVARVGLTGWVCGAHMHFQIQQTCASWWCQSIPATFIDNGDPLYPSSMTSNNCGVTPVCEANLRGDTTQIEESDSACFSRVTSYWWDVGEGSGGHHFYTFATDASAVETWGRWSFAVEVPGRYRVEVFVPNNEADSRQAVYTVETGQGRFDTYAVDQNSSKGWIELGNFDFATGADRFIQLDDNTGENYDSLKRKLAFDAVRLSWNPIVVPPVDDPVEPPPELVDDPDDLHPDLVSDPDDLQLDTWLEPSEDLWSDSESDAELPHPDGDDLIAPPDAIDLGSDGTAQEGELGEDASKALDSAGVCGCQLGSRALPPTSLCFFALCLIVALPLRRR